MALGPVIPGLEPVVKGAIGRVVDALAPWHAPQRLINFVGHETDPAAVAAAYPPAVAARLKELKGRFDPQNLFSYGAALRATS
jgi:hypothetical protein